MKLIMKNIILITKKSEIYKYLIKYIIKTFIYIFIKINIKSKIFQKRNKKLLNFWVFVEFLIFMHFI